MIVSYERAYFIISTCNFQNSFITYYHAYDPKAINLFYNNKNESTNNKNKTSSRNSYHFIHEISIT